MTMGTEDSIDRLLIWLEDIGKKAIEVEDTNSMDTLLHNTREMLERLCTKAAEKGDVKMVSKFRPWNIRSSLSIADTAARCGHIHLCEILATMQHRIDIMAVVGARWGQTKVVEMMLDKGCEYLDKVAEVACQTGHIEIVRLLIRRGYRNTRLISNVAMEHDHMDIVAIALDKKI